MGVAAEELSPLELMARGAGVSLEIISASRALGLQRRMSGPPPLGNYRGPWRCEKPGAWEFLP